MGLFDSIKHAVSGSTLEEEKYFALVAKEIASGAMRPGLWAMALSESEYNENTAKAIYIKLRVAALKEEVNLLNAVQKATEYDQKCLEADAFPAYKRGDYELAFQGFLSLAQKGDVCAQNYLGIMYADGKGVPRDINKAIDLYKKAAYGGEPYAPMNLGNYCLSINDYSSAEQWFAIAEKNGNKEARPRRQKAAELLAEQQRILRLGTSWIKSSS